jgi:malonate decarboxylase gamma subunit
MDWNTLATTLFGAEHGIAQDGDFLHGTVIFDGKPLAVIGTKSRAHRCAARAGPGQAGYSTR